MLDPIAAEGVATDDRVPAAQLAARCWARLCFGTGSRVIACTVVGAFYIKDYVEMQSSDVGIWVMVGVSLVCYCILMGLSYMWFRREVMTVAHFELKRYFGQHCARAGSEPAPLVMSYSQPTQGVLLGALWQITCVVAPRVSRPS